MPYEGDAVGKGVPAQDNVAKALDKKINKDNEERGFRTVRRIKKTASTGEDPKHWKESGYDEKTPPKPEVKPLTLQDLKDAERRKQQFGEFEPWRNLKKDK